MQRVDVVAMASSTGGPCALAQLLPQIAVEAEYQNIAAFGHHGVPVRRLGEGRRPGAVGQGDLVGQYQRGLAGEAGDKKADQNYESDDHHHRQYRDKHPQKP